MCTPRQLPMKVTFQIRPMPSCFSMRQMLTTLSISLRATTLAPKGKYDRLSLTCRMRTLGMSESIAGAPQMICCLTFGAPDDLSAASKTPLSLPYHRCNRCWNCRGFSFIHGYLKDLLNTKKNKLDLTLYGSHMVDHLEGELGFDFTTKQTILSLQKTRHPCQ